MKCNARSTLFILAGLGAAVAVAYAAFPQIRGPLLSASPFLFLLLCPLSMMFMMKGMNSKQDPTGPASTSSEKIPDRTDQP